MAKDEALPFGVGGGLFAIKTLLSRDPCVHANTAIEMIDAILKEHTAAQPAVQEPVKPLCKVGGMPAPGRMCQFIITGGKLCGHKHDCPHKDATPPAAQPAPWEGLTDEEVMQTMSGDWTSQFYFARAIEAKLKEKNNG
jgi:hypothetical protein